MSDIHVRQARLDDTQAISQLFQCRIPVWQRMNAQGQVENVPHVSLTIYERWLHGGPWMSIETGALQLSHLLSGAGMALVAEVEGRPLAYAELYRGTEPAPFGDHLHLGHLALHPDWREQGLDAALIADLLRQVKTLKLQQLTVSRVSDAVGTDALQHTYKLKPLVHLERFSVPARQGQIFYQAIDHLNDQSSQITGWLMPVGRLSSAREQWETLWPRTWEALPEIRQQKTHRMRFTTAGQEALVCCKQQLYNPRAADLYCWSPKAFSNQLLSAVRDWAHREGYRSLVMVVNDETARTLGPEAERDGYTQEICAITP